jgi:hypothetical protein
MALVRRGYRMLKKYLLVVTLIPLGACMSNGAAPQMFSRMVNANAGGTVSAPGAVLKVPPGALGMDTTITVNVTGKSGQPMADSIAASIFDFGPNGTTFLLPVELVINYEGSIPVGKNAIIAFLDNGVWMPLADSSVSGTTVVAHTTHFTPYTVLFVGAGGAEGVGGATGGGGADGSAGGDGGGDGSAGGVGDGGGVGASGGVGAAGDGGSAAGGAGGMTVMCANPCTSGATQCMSGSSLQTCSVVGADCPAFVASMCSAGFVCEGVASAACVDPNWAEWPVPNGPVDVAAGAPNAETYADNGDGTITDNITGLMWQKAVSTSTFTQPQAVAFCPTLTLGTYNDWRLPTIIELASIVDVGQANPSINVTSFPATPSDLFWSSSPVAGSSTTAYSVYFSDGETENLQPITKAFYVRCVR